MMLGFKQYGSKIRPNVRWAWSRSIWFEKVIEEQRIFRNCRKIFSFCSRTFGGHCAYQVIKLGIPSLYMMKTCTSKRDKNDRLLLNAEWYYCLEQLPVQNPSICVCFFMVRFSKVLLYEYLKCCECKKVANTIEDFCWSFDWFLHWRWRQYGFWAMFMNAVPSIIIVINLLFIYLWYLCGFVILL